MLKFLLGLFVWTIFSIPVACAGSGLPYDKCREIAAQHTFAQIMSAKCGFELRQDTSELGDVCMSELSPGHREIAKHFAAQYADEFQKKTGADSCNVVRSGFSVLIAE